MLKVSSLREMTKVELQQKKIELEEEVFNLNMRRSIKQLDTCCFPLQHVAKQALAYGLIDFTIVEGYRTDEKQHQYFIEDKSKVDVGDPAAKHNYRRPAEAFDAAPFVNGAISWKWQHCIFLAGVMLAAAKKVGEDLRWGGNWDMDGEPVTDQEFQDLVHYELVKD